MRLNKKENIALIIGIVVLLVGIFVINNHPKETKELPRVKLKEPEKNKQFALMLEQTKGEGDYQDGSEEYTNTFPTEGYRFNESMSGCIDINGKTIENAIEYDYDNYSITINTSKTAYCYLYYDIYEKPTIAYMGNINTILSFAENGITGEKGIFESVHFVNYIPEKSSIESIGSVNFVDMSDIESGTPANSVVAWSVKNENSGKLCDINGDCYTDNLEDLYIGSKSEIYAIDLSGFFANMYNLKTINDLELLNTSETLDMSSMFSTGFNNESSKLQELDLSNFDTSQVTDMSYMFSGLSVNLPFKDWTNFVTTNVEDMSYMFSSYEGTSLDLSTFDTSSVTVMSNMFYYCTNLTELNMSKATFDKVSSYDSMFGANEYYDARVPSTIHITVKKGQEGFIKDRLDAAYPEGHSNNIDTVE